jgi:PII-like signaling protein
VQGVIVFRGIAGFGTSGEMHAADMLRLSVDLPLVVEFFDAPAVAQAALDLVGPLVPAGHTISWRATRYS